MLKLFTGFGFSAGTASLTKVARRSLQKTALNKDIFYRRLNPEDEESAVDLMKRFFIKNEVFNTYVLKYSEDAIEADVRRLKVTYISNSYTHIKSVYTGSANIKTSLCNFNI